MRDLCHNTQSGWLARLFVCSFARLRVEEVDHSIGTKDRDGALFVGRLSPEKGVRTLLAAWRRLEVPLASPVCSSNNVVYPLAAAAWATPTP